MYQEQYDFLVVGDTSLSLLFNKNTKSFLDFFSITPRQLATRFFPQFYGRRPADDVELIDMISRDTGITDLRYIHGEVTAIRDMLRHTSEPDRFLHTRRSKAVWNSFRKCPVIENLMNGFPADTFPFFQGKRIGVIGIDLFDNLDKNMVSQSMDIIDIGPLGPPIIDNIYAIGNDRQLASNAVDLIDRDKAESFAIVLAPGSPLLDSVRSELYRRNIPFINRMETRQLVRVRDFLRFIELALDYGILRVRSVTETITSFGGTIREGNENHLFSKIPGAYFYGASMDARADDLRNVMRDIRTFTFGSLMEILFHDRPDPHLRRVLERSRMMGSPITRSSYGNLLYLIDNVDLAEPDVPEDERHGVLIADCSDSAYIDRSVVIYLGMGRDWDLDVAGKDYLNPQDELDREAYRMSILLQQGDVRFYLVNRSRNGKDPEPCSTFAKVFGLKGAPKSFKDILPEGREPKEVMWAGDTSCGGLEKDGSLRALAAPYDRDFSATSFNQYAFCPKRFMFGRLIGSSDGDNLLFGDLIHDFAELCATHRDLVGAEDIPMYAEKVNSIYSGISSPVLEELDSCRMVLEMDMIRRFMEHLDVRVPLDRPISKGDNPLMDGLGVTESSSHCESKHQSTDRPMEGRFDLVWNGRVYDHKTGRRMKTPSDVIKGFEIDRRLERNEFYDCQALFYLYLASEHSDDSEPITEFDLFYPLANDIECSDPDYDISRSILRVRITPGTSDDYIRGRVEEAQVDEGGAMFDDRQYAAMERAVEEAEGHKSKGGWLNNKEIRKEVLRSQPVFKDAAVRLYIDLRKSESTSPYFENSRIVDIPRPSLERFVSVVAEMHGTMTEQSRTSFPCSPMGECRGCEYRPLCTGSVVQAEEGGDGDE